MAYLKLGPEGIVYRCNIDGSLEQPFVLKGKAILGVRGSYVYTENEFKRLRERGAATPLDNKAFEPLVVGDDCMIYSSLEIDRAKRCQRNPFPAEDTDL